MQLLGEGGFVDSMCRNPSVCPISWQARALFWDAVETQSGYARPLNRIFWRSHLLEGLVPEVLESGKHSAQPKVTEKGVVH